MIFQALLSEKYSNYALKGKLENSLHSPNLRTVRPSLSSSQFLPYKISHLLNVNIFHPAYP